MPEEEAVAKFGGSSVAQRPETVARLARGFDFVVVSAPGSRGPDDPRTTDLLGAYAIERTKSNLSVVFERYHELANALGVKYDNSLVWSDQSELFHAHGMSKEQIISHGERTSAKLIARAIEGVYVNPMEAFVMTRNSVGELAIDLENTRQVLKEYKDANPDRTLVLPGFQYQKDGSVQIFKRGGSDDSKAIISGALGIPNFNFTDVDGVFTGPPSIVEDAQVIGELSYEEIRALSISGSNVVNAGALPYIAGQRITTTVLNTFNPKSSGTKIKDGELLPDRNRVVSIAGTDGLVKFSVKEIGLNNIKNPGILFRLTEAFDRLGIPIEHALTSTDAVDFYMFADSVVPKPVGNEGRTTPAEAIDFLSGALIGDFADVELQLQPVGMVAIVGHNHRQHPNFMELKAAAFSNTGVKEIASVSASDGIMSIFMVEEPEVVDVMTEFHKQLFPKVSRRLDTSDSSNH